MRIRNIIELMNRRRRRPHPAPIVRAPEVLVLPEIIISESLTAETVAALRSFNTERENHEGIVYWAGLPTDQHLVITTCIVPEAETTHGSYATSALANAEVINLVNRHGLHVVGQVHTHPGAWVGHSRGDVLGAFMPYEGFLSVVVPDYGVRGMLPLHDLCGVHLFHDGQFIRLTKKEIARQFHITPALADLR